MRRRLAVVTTSRADYSHLYWPLHEFAKHPGLELKLIALGAHLSPEFGLTVSEIEKDGFQVDEKLECLLSSDSDIGMAKTIGLATLSLAECLGRMRPDLLLLIADRYEMLAPASVALALRIPVAHIEGGEISEGAIDDAVRNALTKLSHVHFTSTAAARARVISMGEESRRVYQAGAPSLDHLRRTTLWSREKVAQNLDVDLRRPPILVGYHPVTIARETTREMEEIFKALETLHEPLLFCYPNADAGSRSLVERTRSFLGTRADARLFVNLNPMAYWSLLPHALLLLGNSSSGIMEAASFGIPAVDVGIRQQGRERGRNVLHSEAIAESIAQQVAMAASAGFRRSLFGMTNPYGDGHAAERICETIASLALNEELLIKRASG